MAGTLRVVFEWRAEIEEAPYTELGDTARTPKQRAGEDELVRLVQEHLARAAGMALQDVRASCSPNDLGIPSLALASAAGAIAEALGIGSLSLARFATNSLAETARALAAGSEAFVPVTATAPECDGVPTREGASISFGGHGGVALRALVWRSAAGQRPLLIVHGLWENAHLWEHVASRLAQKRDVYVIELRGHGESGRPAEGGYAPSDYALDLEAAAARIEAPQIDVLGFCVGAFAVMSLAAARPGWVHRCILQEPWNGTVDPGQLAAFAALKRETLRTVVAQMRNLFPTRPDWAITKLARALRETANGVFEVENARAEQDLRPLMRRCRSPTLVLRADPNLGGAVDETFSRDLSANLPDAAIVDFPNTSRAIQVERPRLLIELAERFFRGEGTASIPAFFR